VAFLVFVGRTLMATLLSNVVGSLLLSVKLGAANATDSISIIDMKRNFVEVLMVQEGRFAKVFLTRERSRGAWKQEKNTRRYLPR